jgi:hypothetical protein
MSTWMYQIDQQQRPPERYRLEVWDGERWNWPVGRKMPADETPKPGDIVAFFNSTTRAADPGFYGWAVILEWYQVVPVNMYFRPVAPSDALKMNPWNSGEALALADDIRGRVKRGTLWLVRERMVPRLRKGIFEWLRGAGPTSGRSGR